MKRTATFCCILILLFLFQSLASTQSKIVRAYKVENIKVDGLLNEAVWKNSAVEEFIQRDPDEGQPSSEPTKVWVAYDSENLYVAAKLFDSNPDSIDVSLTRRDSHTESDWFFFFVDPYNDKRTGYYFAVNAGGSILDGILFNDSWDDNSWDGVWEAETQVSDDGWSIEMRIPFSQLRFKAADEMTWGVNFNRDIKRRKESSFYVMVPKAESGFVSRFAELKGIRGVEPKQRFELLPYIRQKIQFLKHDTDDPFYKSNQFETGIGADLKLGLGSNLTLDATFNPDFGQVEVDPAVVNLSAFETFYPERRPFFIEGQNIFLFGYGGSNNNWGFSFGNPELFYSRRIGRVPQGSVNHEGYVDYPSETRILGAAKLTGKLDETWSVGALTSVTERTYATVDSSGLKFSEEVEPLTHYGVLRSQKEFNGGKQALGMIFTSVNRDLKTPGLTDYLVRNAMTFGIDGWSFLDSDETYVVTASAVGSYIEGSQDALVRIQEQPYRYFQRPDASFAKMDSSRTSLQGFYSRVMLNKQKGNFYVNSAVGLVTPGFEYNDLGSQWMADRINGHLVLGYRWFESDGFFRRKSIYLAHFRSYNFDSDLLNNGIMLFTNFSFENYYSFNFRARYNTDAYSFGSTRGGPLTKYPGEYWLGIDGGTDTRDDIIFWYYADYWEDALSSYGASFGIELEWKPSSQINISIGPEYYRTFQQQQWVGNFEDPLALNTYGGRYVFGTLNQKTISGNIRLNWTFSPALSLQLFLQPLFSVGSYNTFKELAQPKTYDYNVYGEDGSIIAYDSDNDEYTVDPDGSGAAGGFSFSNPDFNFKSLRGNVVLRWEVLPGSVLYIVWTHDKTNFDDPGNLDLNRDFNNLWNAESNNIFLAKFSYWLDF